MAMPLASLPSAATSPMARMPSAPALATIFPGRPPSDGDHTTAFRVPGRLFMAFGDQLPHADVAGRSGAPLRPEAAADHDLAFSYYFQDPDGNHLELTTYDHEPVRRWLKTKKQCPLCNSEVIMK